MNIEKLIKRVKTKLGHPILDVEITDEMFIDLLSDAHNAFLLFRQLNKEHNEEALNRFEAHWINQYFTALSKECLGNIRGKFSGEMKIPGSDVKLDYEYLIRQAELEKVALIKMLYPEYKYENSETAVISFYFPVGNVNKEDADKATHKFRRELRDYLPDFIKIVIIPIRDGEPRVELVYSNTDKMNSNYLNEIYNQFKDLDSELDKYLPNTDEK